jgi:hypothetical protein
MKKFIDRFYEIKDEYLGKGSEGLTNPQTLDIANIRLAIKLAVVQRNLEFGSFYDK